MPDRVLDAFEICFEVLKNTCNGFVGTAALTLGVTFAGFAGDMLRNIGAWRLLLDGIAAATNVRTGGDVSDQPRRRIVASALRFALRPDLAAVVAILPACAPVLGFPANPADDNAVLTSLQPYFDPSYESRYSGLKDENPRRSLRDEIVINRLRAYELEFWTSACHSGGTRSSQIGSGAAVKRYLAAENGCGEREYLRRAFFA